MLRKVISNKVVEKYFLLDFFSLRKIFNAVCELLLVGKLVKVGQKLGGSRRLNALKNNAQTNEMNKSKLKLDEREIKETESENNGNMVELRDLRP